MGANINALREGSITPVFIAAFKGHADTVKVLADLGTNVNTPNNNSKSPMSMAIQKDYIDVIRILKECETKESYGCSIS